MGFRLWFRTGRFRCTDRTDLSFPLVESHLRFPVIQKCQTGLRATGRLAQVYKPTWTTYLFFLSFDCSFFLRPGLRKTLHPLGFAFFEFFEDRVSDQEVIPVRFVEEIERLEIDYLFRKDEC